MIYVLYALGVLVYVNIGLAVAVGIKGEPINLGASDEVYTWAIVGWPVVSLAVVLFVALRWPAIKLCSLLPFLFKPGTWLGMGGAAKFLISRRQQKLLAKAKVVSE